jgi:hypothetical protein
MTQDSQGSHTPECSILPPGVTRASCGTHLLFKTRAQDVMTALAVVMLATGAVTGRSRVHRAFWLRAPIQSQTRVLPRVSPQSSPGSRLLSMPWPYASPRRDGPRSLLRTHFRIDEARLLHHAHQFGLSAPASLALQRLQLTAGRVHADVERRRRLIEGLATREGRQ